MNSSNNKSTSLLTEYASLLGGAILRHRAHIAEQSARVEAELANKLKSEFIANMSHELRTPLNTVIGFSKLLKQHDSRPLAADQIAEYGGLIHGAAEHLLAIINDILEISKIQSGKFGLERTEVDIDEILTSCAAFFRVIAADAEVSIKLQLSADLPLMLGDSVKLKQIFMNLISNAIKFTPKGGTVTLSARQGGQHYICVGIRDNGIGMSSDDVRVALLPFGQVDGSHTRNREGTGLGLPIARALTQLHGGTFEIISDKGNGTEVRLLLPAIVAKALEPAVHVMKEPTAELRVS